MYKKKRERETQRDAERDGEEVLFSPNASEWSAACKSFVSESDAERERKRGKKKMEGFQKIRKEKKGKWGRKQLTDGGLLPKQKSIQFPAFNRCSSGLIRSKNQWLSFGEYLAWRVDDSLVTDSS